MKKGLLYISVSLLFVVATAFTIQAILNWRIDSATARVKFDTQGTKGLFKGVKGEICFDGGNLSASFFNCTIDVATIYTGAEERDKHLRTSDYFDAAKYPVITFKSSKVEKDGTGFKATGNLTIKDSTKRIIIPFTFDNSNGKGVFKGSVVLNRYDYNVGEPETKQGAWGAPAPDPIYVTLEIPVEKQ